MLLKVTLAVILLISCTVQADLNFLAIGDWGGQDSTPYYEPGQKATAAGMAVVAKQLNSSFVLALGDNFYESGIHGDATNFRFQKTFEDVYQVSANDTSLDIPFYVVAGNHDHLGNVSAQIAYTNLSSRWEFPNHYYKKSFNFTNTDGSVTTLDILFIDTVVIAGNNDLNDDPFDQPPGPLNEQLAMSQLSWLKDNLESSTADYLWVAGHYPVWSGCQHGPTIQLRTQVKPILEQVNATGFVSGHDHCLEYIDEGLGPKYVVTGAADNCCYHNKHENSCPKDSIKFHMWNNGTGSPIQGGFTSFRLRQDAMTVVFHNADGSELYQTPDFYPRHK